MIDKRYILLYPHATMTRHAGSHIHHITTHKTILDARYEVLRAIREYFWSEGLVEIEVPTIVATPGQEPNIDIVEIALHDDRKQKFCGVLHTSPEYTMKKMLASGFRQIFYLGKVFRDYESMQDTHHPEFTMAEWYRAGATLDTIMDDTECVCRAAAERVIRLYPDFRRFAERFVTESWKRISMRELWLDTVGIDLDTTATREDFILRAREKGFVVSDTDQYEEMFYRIFLTEIEPKLAGMGLVMIYDYPSVMASLSRLSPDGKYGRRVEAYVDGVELTNGFEELTDAEEQQARFVSEQNERRAYGKSVYPIDHEFIEALRHMPESSGISLGVDRLVMALTGCKNIEDVLVLPMRKMFID